KACSIVRCFCATAGWSIRWSGPRRFGPRTARSWRTGNADVFGRIVWLVLPKDLTVEVRSLEIAYTTMFFAVSCVLVFAFALVRDGRAPKDGAAGILWISIAFAGTLALGRTFERELQSETLRALLL